MSDTVEERKQRVENMGKDFIDEHRNKARYLVYVKHLQEYLDKFTEGPGGMRGNAVSDAKYIS